MRAFTLIEILIAFAIVSILLGIGMVSLRSFQAQADIHRGTQEVLSVLRLAQNKTVASEDARSYGVFFDEVGNFTLFQGSSYETRTISFDIMYQLPSSVAFSSISLGEGKEVVFSRVTGGAIPGGFFSLQSRTRPLLQETITISEAGVLSVGGSEDDLNESRLIDSRHMHIPYQGREITLTENIVLRFINNELNEIIEEIPVGDNLANGQVFWEGVVDVGG
ncbi:MAG: type II secretion system protein, partial [bacterium]|nr:type II secretion system protein [bacterium]